MPYDSVNDLNAATKKAHPTARARRVFRGAFNAVSASGKSEQSAFKIAHSATDKVEKKHTVKRRK